MADRCGSHGRTRSTTRVGDERAILEECSQIAFLRGLRTNLQHLGGCRRAIAICDVLGSTTACTRFIADWSAFFEPDSIVKQFRFDGMQMEILVRAPRYKLEFALINASRDRSTRSPEKLLNIC